MKYILKISVLILSFCILFFLYERSTKKLSTEDPSKWFEQNFYMTQSPVLGRPRTELLPKIRDEVQKTFVNSQNMRVPGESEDYAWEEVGPDNIGGRTRALMYDPLVSNKVWAGGVTGGLWYINNIQDIDGIWTKVNDFWDNINISCITYDSDSSNVFYVGTGEYIGYNGFWYGNGVWKSRDGGVTWKNLPATKNFKCISDIITRRENGKSVLYISSISLESEPRGLYKSTDGGNTFTKINLPVFSVPLSYSGFYISTLSFHTMPIDLELNPKDNALWIGTYSFSSYITTDIIPDEYKNYLSGLNIDFNNINDGGGRVYRLADSINSIPVLKFPKGNYEVKNGRTELSISTEGAVYLATVFQKKINYFVKSEDNGNIWNNMTLPVDVDIQIPAEDFTRNQGFYNLALAVDPYNANHIVVGGIDLFHSFDGGMRWKQISIWDEEISDSYPLVHADQHAILFSKKNKNEVIFGNDGGVYFSQNLNSSLLKIIGMKNNYNTVQFYSCAIDPTAESNIYLGGTQDNKTLYFNESRSANELYQGDGGYCFIDQNEPDRIIFSSIYDHYAYTNDGFKTSIKEIPTDNVGMFINPAAYDDSLNILYYCVSENKLGRIRFQKNTHTKDILTLPISLGAFPSHIKISPYTKGNSTLFIGTTKGKIFKLNKADSIASIKDITGSVFPKIEANLNELKNLSTYISCIEIGKNENELIATFSNYDIESVFYTSDGGQKWVSKDNTDTTGNKGNFFAFGKLPNIPVRWALFNPYNRKEVLLATELGVWRTNNFYDSISHWYPSNNGLSNVVVMMLRMRDSDKKVIAATYGRGLFVSDGFLNKNLIDISFSAIPNKTIGDAPFRLYASSSSSEPIVYESGSNYIAIVQNDSIIVKNAGSTTISAYLKKKFDYRTGSITTSKKITHPFVVEKKYASITFTLSSKKVEEGSFSLIAESEARLSILYSSSESQILVINQNTATIKDAGIVTVTAYTLENKEYRFAASSQEIPIIDPVWGTKRSQSLSFSALPMYEFGKKYLLTASASSKLPVSYSSSSTFISINSNTISFLSYGTSSITAYQNGNEYFRPATPLIQNIIITIDKNILSHIDKNVSFKIYPNPAVNTISIEATKKPSSLVYYKIIDIRGQEIRHSVLFMNQENIFQLDIQNIKSGNYILFLFNETNHIIHNQKIQITQ